MLITEEQLDNFRNFLIDLEVTRFAVLEFENHHSEVFEVSSMGSTIRGLSHKDGIFELSDNQMNILAKLQFVDNYLQVTINPLLKNDIYYFNNPENPELIFAQPYDFLITKKHLVVFLPAERMSIGDCSVIKAKFSKDKGEEIESIPLTDFFFHSLSKSDLSNYHDIRVFDYKFYNNFFLIEDVLNQLDISEKKKYIETINNSDSPEQFIINCSVLASQHEDYQLAFNFLNQAEGLLKSPFLSFKKWELLFRVGDTDLLREEILEYVSDGTRSLDDHLMGFLSRALQFEIVSEALFTKELIKKIDEWFYNWTDISVDPVWVAFESDKVNEFISKSLTDYPRDIIIRAVSFLMTEYYHKFPHDSNAFKSIYDKNDEGKRFSYDSLLVSIYESDVIIRNKMEQISNENTFQRLLLYIENKFIRGQTYNGYRGFRNRREFMEKEGEEFAESFLNNLDRKGS
jgi:hypothetical protein